MMKFKINSEYILLLSVLFFSSCIKSDDDAVDENSMAEYFRCRINGKEFRANSNWGCHGTTFGFLPQTADSVSSGYMLIAGDDCSGIQGSVMLRFHNASPEVGVINFQTPTFAESVSPMYRVSANEKYKQLISGQMNLTHFRPRELPNGELGLVQGEFEFVVSNDSGDVKIHITEGEFRYRVQESW